MITPLTSACNFLQAVARQRPLFSLGLAVLLSIGAPANTRAQSTTAPGQEKKIDFTTPSEDTYRASLNEARQHAKSGQTKQVEADLTPLNRAKSGTAEWHIETAQRLLQIGEQMTREGNTAATSDLIDNALKHLALADTLARSGRTQAAARTLRGFIQERYLADPTAARASYDAAVQADASSRRAKEAADRLQRTADEEVAKRGKK